MSRSEPFAHPESETPVKSAAPAGYVPIRALLDRLTACVLLLLLSPVIAYLTWRVRRDSKGPAFFQQTRAGRFGRPFTLYKFRTMRLDADPYGDSPQTGDDPRITRLGRWLRETSLDELPQLINVARGEMSLVGPRPLYMQQAAEWTPRQRARLLVPPGLTGLAQINGRGGLTIEEKLEWDVRYVETIGPWTDLTILWKTITRVGKRGDIYEKRYSRERERRNEPAEPGAGGK